MNSPLPVHYRECVDRVPNDSPCKCDEIREWSMNRYQEAVLEFHKATNQTDTLDTQAARDLRAKLIMEEAVETVSALGFYVEGTISRPWVTRLGSEKIADYFRAYEMFNVLDFIDGLCDLTYVVMGGACNANINLDRHFEEVHRANMRKLTGLKREDGKQMKPRDWQPPDHKSIIETYRPLIPGTDDRLNEKEKASVYGRTNYDPTDGDNV